MTLQLRPLATLTITISQHTRIDGVPAHARVIGEAETCELTGDRVRASQAGGSSDWLTAHADGSVSVDARLLLATPTGHHLTVAYRGRAQAMPATGAPVFITPTFETDDPQLQWLNHVQAVGKGIREGAALTYELYELE
jgi:Protein of unknown function (DUF3237)